MRIVDRGSAPVSNAEVLAHITTLEAKYQQEGRKDTVPDDIKTVIRDVHIYFDRPTQPTTRVSMRAHFTPEAIHKLTRKLSSSPYRLLQSEILQILNHVPREVTELSMIVEDAEDRFEENVLEEIVQAIHTILKVK